MIIGVEVGFDKRPTTTQMKKLKDGWYGGDIVTIARYEEVSKAGVLHTIIIRGEDLGTTGGGLFSDSELKAWINQIFKDDASIWLNDAWDEEDDTEDFYGDDELDVPAVVDGEIMHPDRVLEGSGV